MVKLIRIFLKFIYTKTAPKCFGILISKDDEVNVYKFDVILPEEMIAEIHSFTKTDDLKEDAEETKRINAWLLGENVSSLIETYGNKLRFFSVRGFFSSLYNNSLTELLHKRLKDETNFVVGDLTINGFSICVGVMNELHVRYRPEGIWLIFCDIDGGRSTVNVNSESVKYGGSCYWVSSFEGLVTESVRLMKVLSM